MVTELVSSARQLYEESCELLRDKAHNLVNMTIIIICIIYITLIRIYLVSMLCRYFIIYYIVIIM